MSFSVTTEVSVDDWRRFIEMHPDGNVFQTPEMADVFKRSKLHKPMLFAAINEEQQISSLILTIQVKTMRWLPSQAVSRCIAYGGILNGTKRQNNSVPKILRFLDSASKRTSMVTEIRNITDTTSFRDEVVCSGYDYFDYLNYLLRLDRGPDEIFRGFSRSRKQNIINLEKEGIMIQEVHDKEDIVKIYEILRSTYSRVQVPLADISLFQAAFDIMYPLGMVKFYLAKAGEEGIAAAVMLLHKRKIYVWYLGTKNEFVKFTPASLIVWHIIKEASQNGYEILDFLGAGRPEEPYGVREFKRRFGGEQVNYGRYRKVYSPLLSNFAEKAYGFYRKFL